LNNYKPDPTHSIINKTIYSFAITAFLRAVKVQYAFLNIPVLSQIFDRLVKAVAEPIFDYLQKMVTFQVISNQTQKELDAYMKAQTELAEAIKKGAPDELPQKQKDFEKAFSDLISFKHK
jgi:hypothetical protein